jgi:SAM-dependent methyltransferase
MIKNNIISRYKGNLIKLYVFLRHILLSPQDIEKYIPEKGKIVDLGSGFGSYDIYFALKEKKRQIYGFELNKNRVYNANIAAENIKNVKFFVQDFNKNRDINNCDCIIMSDILHHVSKETQDILIMSAKSKLNKTGCLIIKEIWEKPLWKYYYCVLHDKIMTFNEPIFFIKKNDMISKIKKAGFKKIEVRIIKSWLLNPIPHIVYTCKL